MRYLLLSAVLLCGSGCITCYRDTGKLNVGMTRADLVRAWGEPTYVETQTYKGAESEILKYTGEARVYMVAIIISGIMPVRYYTVTLEDGAVAGWTDLNIESPESVRARRSAALESNWDAEY